MMDTHIRPDIVNGATATAVTGATAQRATARRGAAPTLVGVLVLCVCITFTITGRGQLPDVGATLAVAHLAVDHSDVASVTYAPASPIPIGIANACATPLVLTGAITSASPTQAGLLYRDGNVSACGQTGSCAVADTLPHPYQKFDFINGTSDAQCISATIDASACTSDLYSAAYLGSYTPANICTNYLAAMGFSTSSVFTYSFLVPANGAFSIVNTSVYTNALCNSYTLTVRPCSANVAATASLTLTGAGAASGVPVVAANANGRAVITYSLSYKNAGNYSTVIPSTSVLMTPLVQSAAPNYVLLDYGRAGGLIAPGRTISQNVAVIASGIPGSVCLPTTYTLTTQIGASASVYQCNWGNPDQVMLATQIFTGSLMPSPWLAEDRYAFSAKAGWNVTVTVNTVYSDTTFDPKACISATPNGDCLPGLFADDSFECDFPPSWANACPMITGALPATSDGLYYLRVTSFSATRFAGSIGQYRVTIKLATPNTALCPTVQVLENGSRSFLAPVLNQPQTVEASSAWFSATAPPVVVSVPALNPLSPSCGRALLPLVGR